MKQNKESKFTHVAILKPSNDAVDVLATHTGLKKFEILAVAISLLIEKDEKDPGFLPYYIRRQNTAKLEEMQESA